MKKILGIPIRFYKRFISPLLPHVCIYTPSCSTYTLMAIEEYGFFGIWLGIRRIFRCSPFFSGGFDPVKSNPRGKMKWLL